MQKSKEKTTPGDEFYLTYEDYYGNAEQVENKKVDTEKSLFDSGKISYEEFVKQQASTNIFDNDVSNRSTHT